MDYRVYHLSRKEVCTGIDLLHEVREEHEEKQIEDMWAVDSFYQYQTLKEVKK